MDVIEFIYFEHSGTQDYLRSTINLQILNRTIVHDFVPRWVVNILYVFALDMCHKVTCQFLHKIGQLSLVFFLGIKLFLEVQVLALA